MLHLPFKQLGFLTVLHHSTPFVEFLDIIISYKDRVLLKVYLYIVCFLSIPLALSNLGLPQVYLSSDL